MNDERNAEIPPSSTAPQETRTTALQTLSPTFFAMLSLIIVFFLYQFIGGAITYVLFQGDVSGSNVQVVRLATLLGQLIFILVPTVLLVRLRFPGSKGFFRFSMPSAIQVALTLVSVFALQQILQGYMILQESIPLSLPPELRSIVDMLKRLIEDTYRVLVSAHSPGEFIYVVVVIALTPAIAEELLFRGLVLRSFEQTTTGAKAAIVTGIIFAAYHLNPFSFVALAALGTYFGFLVYRGRSIVLSIVAHFFNNLLATIAVYLNLNDNFVAISPVDAVPSTELLIGNFVLFGVVFVASTYYFIRHTSPVEQNVNGE